MKIAVYCITLALIGAIFLGAIYTETSTQAVTSYERVTDLAPIVESDPVDSWTHYNPIRNVTGWSNANYTYQAAPSIYTISEPGTWSDATTARIDSRGVWISQSIGTLADTFLKWSDDGVAFEAPSAANLGGYSAHVVYSPAIRSAAIFWADVSIDLDGTLVKPAGTVTGTTSDGSQFVRSSSALYVASLNARAVAEEWPTGSIITAGGNVAIDTTAGASWRYSESTASNVTIDGIFYQYTDNYYSIQEWTATAATGQYYWNADTQKFALISGYTDDGVPVPSYTTSNLLWWSDDPAATLPVRIYTAGTTHYVAPASAVTIDAGAVASWSNGELNGIVTLLVSPTAAINGTVPGYSSAVSNFDMVELTIDRINDIAYWRGIVNYVSPSEYTALDYAEVITLSGEFAANIPWNSGPQSYHIERGNFVNITYPYIPESEYVIEGAPLTVTSDGDLWRITGRLTETTTVRILDEARLDLTLIADDAPAVRTITVSGPATAYVADTWTQADPSGLLWGNPSVDIGRYFPDLVNVRMVINGYTAAGSAMTVGGHELRIDGGDIIAGDMRLPLAGLKIDFVDGNVAVSNGTRSAELGSSSGSVVEFSGDWYFSSELDEVKERIVTVTTYGIGSFDASVNWCVFTFIGISILTALIAGYYLRGGTTALDWVIVGLADVVALSLLVI